MSYAGLGRLGLEDDKHLESLRRARRGEKRYRREVARYEAERERRRIQAAEVGLWLLAAEVRR